MRRRSPTSEPRAVAAPPGRDRGRGAASLVPAPREGDCEDVRLALKAATTLVGSGDDGGALKWLRRAAESASDNDDDGRATELLKVASVLVDRVEEKRTRTRIDRALDLPQQAQTLASPEALPAATRLGGASTVVPALPPQPNLACQLPRPGFRFHEGEEDTIVRPETRVRRALLALDPDYARRTEYDSDANAADDSGGELDDAPPSSHAPSASVPAVSVPPLSPQLDLGAEPRSRAAEPSTARRGAMSLSGVPNALPALRVVIVPIPEERDVRLMFLTGDSRPPPGAAVALLVPTTPEDAQRLTEIYVTCDAKV